MNFCFFLLFVLYIIKQTVWNYIQSNTGPRESRRSTTPRKGSTEEGIEANAAVLMETNITKPIIIIIIIFKKTFPNK